jgi:hypothetical protein
VNLRINRIAPLATVCLAALALLVGCGGGSSQSASDVAQDYVDARNAGDAAKVCDLYTDQLKRQLGGSNCESFIKEQTGGTAIKFQLSGVDENGDKATATVNATAAQELPKGASQLEVDLVKQDGDWKIDGFGIGNTAGGE